MKNLNKRTKLKRILVTGIATLMVFGAIPLNADESSIDDFGVMLEELFEELPCFEEFLMSEGLLSKENSLVDWTDEFILSDFQLDYFVETEVMSFEDFVNESLEGIPSPFSFEESLLWRTDCQSDEEFHSLLKETTRDFHERGMRWAVDVMPFMMPSITEPRHVSTQWTLIGTFQNPTFGGLAGRDIFFGSSFNNNRGVEIRIRRGPSSIIAGPQTVNPGNGIVARNVQSGQVISLEARVASVPANFVFTSQTN
ncbi:MAG: hypothetical protein FWE02_05700 [Defluviitaleaceae bacterium]|nr:hypothetical protein [Defluviitaleaceae bacterium]